jgi:hypothetical protein
VDLITFPSSLSSTTSGDSIILSDPEQVDSVTMPAQYNSVPELAEPSVAPAPAAVALPSVTAPTLKLAKPTPFNGKKELFLTFIRQMEMQFALARPSPDDTAKIVATISYMTEGLAATWANSFCDQAIGDGGSWGTWAQFRESLEDTFGDPNEPQTAQHRLETLKQNKKTTEEFFLEFDELAKKAGYKNGHDEYLVSLLEKNLNQSLVDRIYQAENLPSNYKGWKDKATALDRLWRRREERKRAVQSFWSLQDESKGQNKPGRKEVGSQSSARTYGGAGEPMVIDRAGARREGRCFKCGQLGHRAFECPDRLGGKQDVRQVVVAEMTAEEKADLLGQIRQDKDLKDFVSAQE